MNPPLTLPLPREEHGDCKTHSRTPLGKWVGIQRTMRNKNNKKLTAKRIELLDELGFIWKALPEGYRGSDAGGEPKFNRAVAAKLVWPDLLIREVLHLGGFDDEYLDQQRETLSTKATNHAWRTNFSFHKVSTPHAWLAME